MTKLSKISNRKPLPLSKIFNPDSTRCRASRWGAEAIKETEKKDELLVRISIREQMEDDEMKALLAERADLERAVLAGEAEAPV
jgi:hypothetical protein